MANTFQTPNMNLQVPVVGVETGPQYASDINACFQTVDQHDHASGNGVPVTPAGLSINADLSFLGNNAITLRSSRYSAQLSALATASDLNCVYTVGVDLYYNDGNGNHIQITQNGGIAGSPGSIANLSSPASASYVSGNQTFIWQSAANTAANMDGGSIILRNITASSNGVTISAPNALAANYSLVLPAALPAGQRFMTLDNSGNIAGAWNVDNSTVEISSSTLQVKALGITAAQIANATITGAKLVNGTITRTQLIPVGEQVSSSSGLFNTTSSTYADVTNLTVTITTTGAPVQILFMPDGDTGTPSLLNVTNASGGGSQLRYKIFRDSTVIAFGTAISAYNAQNLYMPPGALNMLDVVAAGTYVYKLQVAVVGGSSPSGNVQNIKMAAYELL